MPHQRMNTHANTSTIIPRRSTLKSAFPPPPPPASATAISAREPLLPPLESADPYTCDPEQHVGGCKVPSCLPPPHRSSLPHPATAWQTFQLNLRHATPPHRYQNGRCRLYLTGRGCPGRSHPGTPAPCLGPWPWPLHIVAILGHSSAQYFSADVSCWRVTCSCRSRGPCRRI